MEQPKETSSHDASPEKTETGDAEKQKDAAGGAVKTLEKMEAEGLVLRTKYGKTLFNIRHRLKDEDESAARARYDCIVNYDAPYNITITMRAGLKDFRLPQGSARDEQTWASDEKKLVTIELGDIVRALEAPLEQRAEPIVLRRYELEDLHPPFMLLRPQNAAYYTAIEYPDPVIKGVQEEIAPENLLASQRIIEASLYAADKFIRTGDLEFLKKYYDSWKEIKTQKEMTFHELRERWVPARDGWGRTPELYAFPDFYEYVAFDAPGDLDAIKNELKERTFRAWLAKQKEGLDSPNGRLLWVGDVSVNGREGKLKIATRRIRNNNGWVDRYEHPENEEIIFEQFERMRRVVIES